MSLSSAPISLDSALWLVAPSAARACLHLSGGGDVAHRGAVRLIYKVSLHLDNRQLPGLVECAAVAYDRPVARRWRRALFMARWAARLRMWRAAFTEVWLQPGGVGEQQLAKRFKAHATAHEP